MTLEKAVGLTFQVDRTLSSVEGNRLNLRPNKRNSVTLAVEKTPSYILLEHRMPSFRVRCHERLMDVRGPCCRNRLRG